MNILQRLKDGANRATEKAQHVVEVNKLNGQISEIEQQKNSYYLQMGKVFYEGYRMQDMSIAEKEMIELAKTCDGLQEKIESIRNRIALLKNERVCECGRVVALDANFCPNCGSKLARLVPEEADPAEKTVKEPEFTGFGLKDDEEEEAVKFSAAADERVPDPFAYRPEPDEFDPEEEELRKEAETERLQLEQEEREKERRQWEELERERERQLELDRRIRFWQENNQNQDYASSPEETVRDTVKCQICSVDLPKGSKWCPRCGAEQI